MSRTLLAAGGAPKPPTVSIATSSFTIGGTLTATLGGGAYTGLRWQRDDAFGQSGAGSFANIGGATASTYSPVSADIGFGVRLAVDWSGGTVLSNTLRYLYASVAAVVEVFEIYGLTPGSIASIVGAKAGFTLSQAVGSQQPAASLTSFNGKPGLSFLGMGHNSVLRGTCDLSAFASLRVVMGQIDTTNAFAGVLELTADATTTNGGFLIDTNTSSRVEVYARGTTNFGAVVATEDLSAACVMSYAPTTTLTKGCAFVRKNGVALSLTTVVNTCGAGNFANAALNWGARNNGASAPWTGVNGGALMMLSGTAQDGDLADAEAYVKNGGGL